MFDTTSLSSVALTLPSFTHTPSHFLSALRSPPTGPLSPSAVTPALGHPLVFSNPRRTVGVPPSTVEVEVARCASRDRGPCERSQRRGCSVRQFMGCISSARTLHSTLSHLLPGSASLFADACPPPSLSSPSASSQVEGGGAAVAPSVSPSPPRPPPFFVHT
jgi:hypothetical protein